MLCPSKFRRPFGSFDYMGTTLREVRNAFIPYQCILMAEVGFFIRFRIFNRMIDNAGHLSLCPHSEFNCSFLTLQISWFDISNILYPPPLLERAPHPNLVLLYWLSCVFES